MSKVEPVRIRVRYSEADRMGLLYHVNHLEYFELARSHWIRTVWRPYLEIENSGYAIVVIRAEVNYHRPAYYDDELLLFAEVSDWGASRVEFAYRIERCGEAEPICTGRTVHCFIDKVRKPVKMPPELAAILHKSQTDLRDVTKIQPDNS